MENKLEKLKQQRPLRVCAYVRRKPVPAALPDIQTEYYNRLINGVDGWTNAGIYTDLRLKDRDMKRMLKDCKKRKIDLIITKSVSRFSRDVRKFEKIMSILKKCGVGVFFELENLYSLDAEAALRFDMLLAD